MKSLLLGGVSVLAVVLGLSGSASAQAIDIGDLAGGLGDLVGDISATVTDLADVDVSALNGLTLPGDAGTGGVYTNTAFNVAPNIAANVTLSAPLDVDAGVLGAISAAGAIGVTPGTSSTAIAVSVDPAALVAALGGAVVTGDQTATAVGVLANQAIQTANGSAAAFEDGTAINVNGGTIAFNSEATSAAAQAGTAASNATAALTTLDVDGPDSSEIRDVASSSITGPLQDIYASNLAFNLAPQLAANLTVGTDVTTGVLAATAVGTLANQTISVGLDGAAISSSLTGNFAGAGADD